MQRAHRRGSTPSWPAGRNGRRERRLAPALIVLVVCLLLIATNSAAAEDHAATRPPTPKAVQRTDMVARQPGFRASRQRAHDDYLAAELANPLTHRFPAGVLVSIQREADAEAARAPDQRRARPGRFCGAAAFTGVSPAPQLSLEDVFAPSKRAARTQFTAYPRLEVDLNTTECVGDEAESATQTVHEVINLDASFPGLQEVLPFVPEGEVWTLTIPATLFYGARAIDMITIPDFCLIRMVVRMDNVWSQRLPVSECRARLNDVMGYDVDARDAAQARTTVGAPLSDTALDATRRASSRNLRDAGEAESEKDPNDL